MLYKPKHFKVQEFVPKEVYERWGDDSLQFMDARILKLADIIKEAFPKGTMTINNWFWQGDRNWSGLRIPERPYYSIYSQHSAGRAIDCIFSEYSAQYVRDHILNNPTLFPGASAIEMDVSWLHVDCRNCFPIKKFYP